jgi:hypothetical protein
MGHTGYADDVNIVGENIDIKEKHRSFINHW